jgi:hypothetical protein
VQAQPVRDQRPRAHLDVAGRDDLEVQQGRRDRLEVAGVGEEVEDLLRPSRQLLVADEGVDAHHPVYG